MKGLFPVRYMKRIDDDIIDDEDEEGWEIVELEDSGVLVAKRGIQEPSRRDVLRLFGAGAISLAVPGFLEAQNGKGNGGTTKKEKNETKKEGEKNNNEKKRRSSLLAEPGSEEERRALTILGTVTPAGLRKMEEEFRAKCLKGKKEWETTLDPNTDQTRASHSAEKYFLDPEMRLVFPSDLDAASDWTQDGKLSSKEVLFLVFKGARKKDGDQTKVQRTKNWYLISIDTFKPINGKYIPQPYEGNPFGIRNSQELYEDAEESIYYASKLSQRY